MKRKRRSEPLDLHELGFLAHELATMAEAVKALMGHVAKNPSEDGKAELATLCLRMRVRELVEMTKEFK